MSNTRRHRSSSAPSVRWYSGLLNRGMPISVLCLRDLRLAYRSLWQECGLSRRRKFRNFKLRHYRMFTACELQTQRLFTALYTETYRGYSQGCPHDFPPHDLRHGWICRRWVIAKAAKGPTARDRTKNERGPPTEAALRLPVTQQQAHDPVANPLTGATPIISLD